MEISQKLFDKLTAYIQDNQPEMYWDRNDLLNADQVAQIMESKQGQYDVENEIYEFNWEYIHRLEKQLIKETIEWFIDELVEDTNLDEEYERRDVQIDVLYDELFDQLLDYVHYDLNISELFGRSLVCGNVVADIETPCSGWGFGYYNIDYGDCDNLLDFFNVNPKQIADMMGATGEQLSRFPDYPGREGNEWMEPKELVEMWSHHTTESGWLTFCVELDIQHFVENRDKYEQGIRIKAGACAFFHDSWNGACGLGGVLQKDLTLLPTQYDIKIDGRYGYGLDDICGFVKSEVWNSPLDYAIPSEELS